MYLARPRGLLSRLISKRDFQTYFPHSCPSVNETYRKQGEADTVNLSSRKDFTQEVNLWLKNFEKQEELRNWISVKKYRGHVQVIFLCVIAHTDFKSTFDKKVLCNLPIGSYHFKSIVQNRSISPKWKLWQDANNNPCPFKVKNQRKRSLWPKFWAYFYSLK